MKERILDGVFQPSQKLIENDLALEIGVSRNTVKKALLKLEQENLVVLENNKGATIKSFSLEEISNYLKIREALEGLIAADAAKNITDMDIEQLENILGEMKQHLQTHQFDAYSQGNLRFHDVIYRASNNQQAVDIVRIIKQQLKRVQFKTILVPGRNENSFKEHHAILDAIRSRDVERAEIELKNHVANVRHTIVNHYNVLM
ncbi:GntR family transcriptional regulator [Lysinibacillus sp. 2017]|nr:GntR family transcriptional regulator [Lysinibacillus sp. 2017]TGN35224.1 GntR family transcriptional regulator [Lysinibacillus sp. S2017]